MAVERGDGSLRWVGAAGDAAPDGRQMTADTPFFLASVTKLYIAAAVLKLCERGLLGLDQPLPALLPRPLIAGLHRREREDSTDRITVRNLLAHTSGLPDWLEERPHGGRSLLERLVAEGDRPLGIEVVVETVREGLTPHFPPQPPDARRPRVRYSDTNYQLLIAIVEAATSRPLHAAFADLLLRPLDLRHTFHPAATPLAPTPEAASVWAGSQPLELPLALRSVGDLYATAADAIAFLRALVRGEVFEEAATLDLMQGPWKRLGFHPTARRLPGWPIEYGLGMMRFRLPRLLTPFRPLPPVVGHSGSTGSWLFHCPELDLFLAGTVDQVTAGAVPYRVVPKLIRLLS